MIKKVVIIIMLVLCSNVFTIESDESKDETINTTSEEGKKDRTYLGTLKEFNYLISISEETDIDKETIFEVEFPAPEKYTYGLFRKKTYTYYPTNFEFGFAYNPESEYLDKDGWFLLTYYDMENNPVYAQVVCVEWRYFLKGGDYGDINLPRYMCGKKYKCKVQMLEDFKIKLPEKVRFYFSTQTTK